MHKLTDEIRLSIVYPNIVAEWSEKNYTQSLGALAHICYQEPGTCGYELAAMYMKEIGHIR